MWRLRAFSTRARLAGEGYAAIRARLSQSAGGGGCRLGRVPVHPRRLGGVPVPRPAARASVHQEGGRVLQGHAAHGARRAGERRGASACRGLLSLRLAAEGRLARVLRLRRRVQFRSVLRAHPVDRAGLRHPSRARRRGEQVPLVAAAPRGRVPESSCAAFNPAGRAASLKEWQASHDGSAMRHTVFVAAIVAALAASCDADAVGTLASVSLIDQDSGALLPLHYFRGEYWVAGNPGSRYAIEIRSHSGGRLLAVTSVDGVSVLSGDTAGWEQSGYVFDPGESYQITGWRKSHTEVAAFTFTDSPNSYAERTGRPANVGVIGVAVFRERPPPQVFYSPPQTLSAAPRGADTAREPPASLAGGFKGGMAGQSAPTAGRDAAAPAAAASVSPANTPAARLGTGHGEREYSYVVNTEFRRLQPEPAEVIRIRYDSLDNLVAMGIVGRPRPTPPPLNPFPGSQERQYVPDPPG